MTAFGHEKLTKIGLVCIVFQCWACFEYTSKVCLVMFGHCRAQQSSLKFHSMLQCRLNSSMPRWRAFGWMTKIQCPITALRSIYQAHAQHNNPFSRLHCCIWSFKFWPMSVTSIAFPFVVIEICSTKRNNVIDANLSITFFTVKFFLGILRTRWLLELDILGVCSDCVRASIIFEYQRFMSTLVVIFLSSCYSYF